VEGCRSPTEGRRGRKTVYCRLRREDRKRLSRFMEKKGKGEPISASLGRGEQWKRDRELGDTGRGKWPIYPITFMRGCCVIVGSQRPLPFGESDGGFSFPQGGGVLEAHNQKTEEGEECQFRLEEESCSRVQIPIFSMGRVRLFRGGRLRVFPSWGNLKETPKHTSGTRTTMSLFPLLVGSPLIQ